jgi:hypothetical protein
VAAVSALAFIMLAAPAESFAHEGINPQRINDNSRTGFLGLSRVLKIYPVFYPAKLRAKRGCKGLGGTQC